MEQKHHEEDEEQQHARVDKSFKAKDNTLLSWSVPVMPLHAKARSRNFILSWKGERDLQKKEDAATVA